MFSLRIAAVSLTAWFVSVGWAAEPQPADVSYYRDVRPIFQANCQGCHQPAKPLGEYVMTDFAQMLAGGETGDPAVVPGKPEESYLVAQITSVDGSAEMPKGKPPLAESEVALIRRWIAQGAKNDTPMSARAAYTMANPPTYEAAPVITSLDFSPSGDRLAISGYHEVVVYRGDGSERLARLVGLSERIESVRFSPDGKRLAVAGGSPGRMGELQVWDVEKQELLLAKTVGYDTCYGANWSPDGKLVSIGCPDNSVRAFRLEDGEQVLFNAAHNDWVLDTVFSVKGTHLVTVSRDMSMKLYEVATERFIDNVTSITPGALKGGLNAVDRHPQQDHLLIGGADGVPKLYQMFRTKDRKIGDDFNKIRQFGDMPGRVFSVDFNADGSRFAAGSSYNQRGTVRVYETGSGKQLSQAEGELGAIYAVSLSPDGQRVAAAGFDGQVRLIDADSGKALSSFVPIPLDDEK